MTFRLIAASILYTVLCSCSVSKSPCIKRVGNCFDLEVQDQRAVALHSTDKVDTYVHDHSIPGRINLRYVEWEIAAPVPASFSTNLALNHDGKEWFGENLTSELTIMPLQGQRIPGLKQQSSLLQQLPSFKIPIGENAVVLPDHMLPPGDYLLIATMRGDKNWDRKYVMAHVS